MKTRNGTPFRLYCRDGAAPYSLHGALWTETGWVCHAWTVQGYVWDTQEPNEYDIAEAIRAGAGVMRGSAVFLLSGVN